MTRAVPWRFLLACPGAVQAPFDTGAPSGPPGRELIHVTGGAQSIPGRAPPGDVDPYPGRHHRHGSDHADTAAWLKGERVSRFDAPVRYVIYSHLMEYALSIADNAAAAYRALIVRQGRERRQVPWWRVPADGGGQ